MTVVNLKGARGAPRDAASKMETMYVSLEQVESWRIPPFQRPLRVNDKVRSMAEEIKADGVLTGVITLGRIAGDRTHYIVDGQHRIEAFKISAIKEVLADLRIMTFDKMSEMAQEFVRLNSAIVRMGPDDILRGLEGSCPGLGIIVRSCDFVGYAQVRRNPDSPVIGMSQVLRCWAAGVAETPSTSASSGRSAAEIAETLAPASAEELVRFLLVARAAWGTDVQNFRLWSSLNLALCMWLWCQLVVKQDRGVKRFVRLTPEQFRRCLMSVSADSGYVDWLLGRKLSDRDRAPCFNRLKALFAARLRQDSGKPDVKPLMPAPGWARG